MYVQAQIKEKNEDGFTAVASTEVEDRQGEVVRQAGWSLTNYKKNPILLWMHDHTKPLGKATRIWLDKTGSSPILKFKGVISTATEWGKAAQALMDEGILTTFSVGFRALEAEGDEIVKAELYEISLVTVPANPEARTLAVKKLEEADIEEEVIEDFKKSMSQEETEDKLTELNETIGDFKKRLAQVENKTELAVKGLKHLNPQRSKAEIVTARLSVAKVIARTADKLLTDNPQADSVKIIKRSSDMLIRSLKGDI